MAPDLRFSLAGFLLVACGALAAAPAATVADSVVADGAAPDATTRTDDALADETNAGSDADSATAGDVVALDADGAAESADAGGETALEAAGGDAPDVKVAADVDASELPPCVSGTAAVWSESFDGGVTFPVPTPVSGTLGWHLDKAKAHSAPVSLAFSNNCGTLDGSATLANGCKTGGLVLPADNLSLTIPVLPSSPGATLLRFFIWQDGLGVGTSLTCKPTCGLDKVCVDFTGTPMCAAPKVSLRLAVNDKLVWTSAQLPPSANGTWSQQTVPLPAGSGSIKLNWTFVESDGSPASGPGVWVDDVDVLAACGP